MISLARLCLAVILSGRSSSVLALAPSLFGRRWSTQLFMSSEDPAGKTIYQRLFYRFSPASDVEVHDSVTLEERLRFQPDPERAEEGYLKPIGHRTLILRDGASGNEIGDEIFRLDVHDGRSNHVGADADLTMDSTIATILFIASNPNIVQGNVLELSCGIGLAGLLGSIGAAHVANKSAKQSENIVENDVLTVPEHDTNLPKDLELLTLSDGDENQLNLALHNCKNANVPAAKVALNNLNWSQRIPQQGRLDEYDAIIASDVDFSFPNSKDLAKTVAFRLKPSSAFGIRSGAEKKSPPRFVHICPDTRENIPYLHKFLQEGYRMSVSTGYLKLEKFTFALQTVPIDKTEDEIEDIPLEVQKEKELFFQSLTAQHHPDYTGEGSGEYFFPMETGEYDQRSGKTFLEPDAGGSPW